MNTDWMVRAACVGHDPEIFFPGPGGAASGQVARAQAICAQCPVTAECAQLRRDTHSAFGIWGGAVVRTKSLGPSPSAHLIRHGTNAGYKAHLRRGSTACHSCQEAHRWANREREQARA